MKKTVIFYFICFAAFLFLLRGMLLIPNARIKPVLCAPVYNMMNIIINYKAENNDDVLLKINDEYYMFSPQRNLIGKYTIDEVNTLDILVKKGLEEKIKEIVIFNDIKTFYFKDFSKFKKEEFRFCENKQCSVYNKYQVPEIVKYNKSANSYNYHSHINTVCVGLFALFGGHFVFIPFYILAFIALLYFTNNKNEINFKTRGYLITALIFIGGIVTYSNGLLDYMPWTDEYRTIEYSIPTAKLSALFSDPGNPPLYYILTRIVFVIFGVSTVSLKMLPLIISFIFLLVLWFVLYKKFNLKIANIGVLLAVINVPLVYYAQEARSYIFQALLSPLLFYYLFNIFEKNDKRNYVIYGILVAVASNVHYYEILLLFSNLVFAIIYFLIQKRYKDIYRFTLANILGGLFFLPFFIKTSVGSALMNPNFNSWIPNIDLRQIQKCVYYLFGGLFSLIISLCLFVRNLFLKEKSLVVTYSFFVIVLTILCAIILSYTIRPMLVERYLVLLAPLFIIFICSCFNLIKNSKGAVAFFIIWIFLMQGGFFEKNNRRKGIIELPLTFSKQYYEANMPKNNVYAIINFSNPEYLENADKLINKKINYISESVLSTEDTVVKILKDDKNAIIFTSNIVPNKENSAKGDNYTCFFNRTTDTCLWRIENEK